MQVPGSPAVIWNTVGQPSFFAKRESPKVFVFPMILKGFWETLSKVDPLQCVAGAPLRQRSGDPAPTRICWVAEIFKSVCFSNDFEVFLGNGAREPTPKMMRWAPLRQHSGASGKTLVFLCFPMVLRMRALRGARTGEAHSGARRVRSDLLGSGILQKCLFFQ